MGGFQVAAQPFRVYQAIDWLCRDSGIANQINGVRRIREMVEKGKTDDMIRVGAVARLAELLESTSNSNLQSEIIWTLVNIAAGTSSQTELVLRKGLPMFVKILQQEDSTIKNDVLLALSNIAGDSAACRDKLLATTVLHEVLKLLEPGNNLDPILEKNCIWFMANLCRHKELPVDIAKVKVFIPILVRIVTDHKSHADNIVNACWALKYLSDGTSDHIDALLEAKVCQALVDLIEISEDRIQTVALLVCVNITSGSHKQTQELIDAWIIPVINRLLDSSKDKTVIRNVCHVISNIAAGTDDQIELLFADDIFEKLPALFDASDNRTQVEIFHIVSNSIFCASQEQKLHLKPLGCVKIIESGLFFAENGAIKLSLESLLFLGTDELSSEAISRIEELTDHENYSIGYNAFEIMEKFYRRYSLRSLRAKPYFPC